MFRDRYNYLVTQSSLFHHEQAIEYRFSMQCNDNCTWYFEEMLGGGGGYKFGNISYTPVGACVV